MFTIKFMDDGGYTAYECVSYGVSWSAGVNSVPMIHMNPTRDTRDSQVDTLVIPVTNTAYVENSSGKTIDKIVASEAQSNPIPPR